MQPRWSAGHRHEHQPQLAPTINLLDVVRGMGRRKLVIIVFTLLALCAGLGIVKVLKPTYSTEAQILIENLASPFDRTQSPDEQRPDPVDDRVIKSQISVLKSQDVALRVITSLNLQERPEFDSLKKKSMGKIKQLLLAFGFGEDPRLQTPQQRALDRLTDGLTVYQIPESNVVAVKYSSSDPKTAAEVANALVKIYVASTAETNSQPTTRARDWIAGQIEDLRKKVASSDASIEEFRSQAGLLQGENSTLGTQELSELNTQITLAEGVRTEAEQRAKSIKNILATKGTVVGSTDVLNSTIVQSLREQQVTSARRVAELSATYLPGHPKMIAAQNDLRNIDRQIRNEALKLVDSLDQQAKIAEAREQALRARLEEMKGRESTANLASVKLKALERESAADKALLEIASPALCRCKRAPGFVHPAGHGTDHSASRNSYLSVIPQIRPARHVDHAGRTGIVPWSFIPDGDHGGGKQVGHAGCDRSTPADELRSLLRLPQAR